MSYLGIDIGSSQVKAVVFNAEGVELAHAYARYAFTVPEPDAMELDGNTVLASAFKVLAECAAKTAGVDPVETIAVSSQGEAFSPLDKDGRILAPAMISGDSRATQVMADFTAAFGLERIYRKTGHTPSAMFSLAKLLYIRQRQPELYRHAARFLCFEDLLVNALGGQPFMGYPEAGRTMLFDVSRHAWDDELLNALGLTPGHFAVPVPSGTVTGTILPEIAARLGFNPAVKLVSGGHDQIIGAYGCGATTPGTAMYAAGSVECLVPVFDSLVLSPELCRNNLCTYDFAEPGKYASVAYSLTGSNLLEYFLKTLAPDRHDDYAALLAEMPPEPTRLLSLPYFTPSGTPYFDEKTPGCLYGWRLGMSRGTVLKALEEGIALEMKLNFDLLKRSGIHVERLIATGGGFRNAALVQLHADVLGLPIATIEIGEAGCRGAASLGMRALTGKAMAAPAITGVVQPRADQAACYQDKFQEYCRFSQMLRAFARQGAQGS